MKNIAKRTNRTRDEQRPPRLAPQVDASILANLGFVKSRPAPKPAVSKNSPKNKSGSTRPPSTAMPAAREPAGSSNQTGSNSQTLAKNQPVTNDPPEVKNQPASNRKSEAKDLPETIQPSLSEKPRPLTEGQPSGEKEESVANGGPVATGGPMAKDGPEANSPQIQKNEPEKPEVRPPARIQSTMNFQDKKSQTNSPAPVEPTTPPASRVPYNPERPGQNGYRPTAPRQPETNDAPGGKVPGTNGNGANHNGKDGTNSGVNGSSGSANGYAPRSSLFRPGAFTSMPAVRVPPKASGPAQKPPVQIPMEPSARGDSDINDRREETPRSEIPLTPQPENRPAPAPQKPPAANASGLEHLLQKNDLPDQAVLFGLCEDGLPVLLDLDDPTPGAVVIMGDQREAQLEILRTAVSSLAGRNSPRNVQFLVFSCEPEAWQRWIEEKGFTRHSLAVERADAETVRDWIIRLADWTEQRRLGQTSGPSVLLVMDTLSFLPQLEYDVRLNFDWMAKEGPQARVWPVAVISSDLAKSLSGRRLLRAFQTRIIGYANNPADWVQLAGLDEQEAATFDRRDEFAVKVGDKWLRFYLPGSQ